MRPNAGPELRALTSGTIVQSSVAVLEQRSAISTVALQSDPHEPARSSGRRLEVRRRIARGRRHRPQSGRGMGADRRFDARPPGGGAVDDRVPLRADPDVPLRAGPRHLRHVATPCCAAACRTAKLGLQTSGIYSSTRYPRRFRLGPVGHPARRGFGPRLARRRVRDLVASILLRWRIGVLGGALAVSVHAELEFWHTAQPESFGGILTAWALVLATFEPRPRVRSRAANNLNAWVAAGALYGAAFLMKPPLGGGARRSAIFAALAPVGRTRGFRSSNNGQALAPVGFDGGRQRAMILLICSSGSWFAAPPAISTKRSSFHAALHQARLGRRHRPGHVLPGVEEWLVDLSSPNAVGVLAALMLAPIAAREREGVLHIFSWSRFSSPA